MRDSVDVEFDIRDSRSVPFSTLMNYILAKRHVGGKGWGDGCALSLGRKHVSCRLFI